MHSRRGVLLSGAALGATLSAGCFGVDDGSDEEPTEPTEAIPEEPRVDEPPYEVETQPDDRDEYDPLYLCANMPDASERSVQMVPGPRADLLLSTHDPDSGEDAYAVRALTSADEVREVFDLGGSDDDGQNEGDESVEEPLDAVDFERYVLVVVEDGYGSGSVTHHFERAEETDRGFRLHGCLRIPYERTDDLSTRHSVVKVERPEDFEFARVSLTVDADRRVHVNSTEGVVTVEPDG